MNYKTSKAAEEESLLASAWLEHNHVPIPNDPQGPNRPADILTPARQSPTKDKLRPNNSDVTESTVGILAETSRNVVNFNGDKLDTTSVDASNNTEANKSSRRPPYRDWVSFEENSNHTNSQGAKTFTVSLNDETSNGNTPGRYGNEDKWIVFDMPKTNGGQRDNSTSFVQPLESQQDTIQRVNIVGEVFGGSGGSLTREVLSNPFDNTELNRINPFLQTTREQQNGCSTPDTTPTHSTPGPPTTCQITAAKLAHSTSSQSEAPSMTTSQESLPEYPEKPSNKTWSVWLRYPDAKRKLRPREWRPVILKLDGSVLQVFEEGDQSAPFREVSLQCFYELTSPNLQHYLGGKVHTVKIMYVKYKETSKRLAKKSGVQYVSKSTPILKIASTSHLVIHEFIEVVKDAIRSLPIFRDRGISHNTEAVYINVHDTCSALLDSKGNILMIGILVRVYLRAFISGDAECELVLNDIHVKSQEEARLREEDMPQRVHKWINVENCNFHSTVSPDSYNQNHYLIFHPLDSCTFEVMQFRVRQLKPLPLLVKCDLVFDDHGRVELRAEVKLCSDAKLAKYQRKNICLYFSIPDVWVHLFMTHTLFRGERFIRSTSSQKAIKMRNKLNRPPCTIEVSTGSAMYEPEYKSVVWRINQLPILNTTAPADSAHDFKCQIQTQDLSGLPEDYTPHCTMEYEIPYTVASDTNIINFKVSEQKIGTQEVSYNAFYSYKIQMEVTHLNGLQDDRWIHD